MKRKLTALLVAAVLLLTPALALAEQIDIDGGSLIITATEYTQGGGAPTPYSGSADVYSQSGTTGNTVTFDTSGGTVNGSVTGVTFTGSATPNEAAIRIIGDGTANVALDTVAVTGDNTALSIEHGSGGAGPTANLDMTGVDIDITGAAAAVTAHNSTVNMDVNGANEVDADGIALSMHHSDVTITGDSAGDALKLTSASALGTVSGDGSSTLAVTGAAVLDIVNTGGHEAVQGGVAISDNTGSVTGGTGGGTGSIRRIGVVIPTVEELKAMGKEEIQALTPQQIRALTRAHIEVLSAEQISWLTEQQIQALTPQQISWLTEQQMQALTKEQIQALSEAQIQAVPAWMIHESLDKDWIQALTEKQIVLWMTEEQILALELALERIFDLTSRQWNAFDTRKSMMDWD